MHFVFHQQTYSGLKVLIIDNYDSFTYNLYHYLEQLADEVDVYRNDEISLDDCEYFSHIVISPGPGLPREAGICMKLIERYHLQKPIFGVCLGCQALAEFFGGRLYNQNLVAHGIQRKVVQTGRDSWLLREIPDSFKAGLYHSWAIDETSLPTGWKPIARSEYDVLMAIEHTGYALAGVQFHPESIMSEHGLQIFRNWLQRSSEPSGGKATTS